MNIEEIIAEIETSNMSSEAKAEAMEIIRGFTSNLNDLITHTAEEVENQNE